MKQLIKALLVWIRLIKTKTNRQTVYLGNNTVLTQNIYNNRMYLDSRDISLTPQIITDGYWEKAVSRFYARLVKPGMTVLEIGANVGWFSLLAGSRIGNNGRLILVEANPEIVPYLYKNIELNGFHDITTIINKAASDKKGSVQFQVLEHHKGGSSIASFSNEFLQTWMDSTKTISVESIQADSVLTDKIQKIDIVKIDAEGSEPLIFKGMAQILQNKDIQIVCEFYARNIEVMGLDPEQFLDDIVSAYKLKLQYLDKNGRARFATKDEIMRIGECELYLTH